MAAYVIVEIEVHDAAGYEEYKPAAAATIAKHGGKYLVRGGAVTTLEGDWQPKRIVILEFPSADRAHAWWHSEEYEAPREIRQRTATTRMIAVEGA